MFTLIIIYSAKYLFLVSIVIFLIYLWKTSKKNRIAIIQLTIISFPITWLTAKILSFLIFDPRPFVVDHVTPLIPHVADNGFPSDHTLITMAIASVVFAYNRKIGSVLIILALIVGTARVLARVHHPLDIIGSTVIATCITFLVYKLIKLASHKRLLLGIIKES